MEYVSLVDSYALNNNFRLIMSSMIAAFIYIVTCTLASIIILNHDFGMHTFEWLVILLTSITSRIDIYLAAHYYCPWLMVFPRHNGGSMVYYYMIYESLPYIRSNNPLVFVDWMSECLLLLSNGLIGPFLALIFLLFSSYISLKSIALLCVSMYNWVLRIIRACNRSFKYIFRFNV